MSRVTVGLVDNVEKNRIERRRQTRDDSLLHSHRSSPPVKRIATYIPYVGMRALYPDPLAPLVALISVERFGACPRAAAVIKVMTWI
jgi:hypothetical protein